jgi:DNA polymerase III gamma/tau subunit
MPKPIITRYRPKDLDEFFGNKAVVKVARGLIDDEEGRAQTYLFTGEKGCGKTTLAKLLASEFGADDSMVAEIDCLQDRSIGMVRDIHNMMSSPPIAGTAKAFIIDECHTLPKLSQEGFLKDTEEPPGYAYFFLCSTEPNRILGTLRDRCLELELKRLRKTDAGVFMTLICDREEIEFNEKLFKTVLRVSEGNPRKILKALYLTKLSDEDSLKELLRSVDEDDPEINALSRCLLYKSGSLVKILNSLSNKEPESVRKAVLIYMQKVILNPKDRGIVPKAVHIAECFSEFPSNGFIDIILATFDSIGE